MGEGQGEDGVDKQDKGGGLVDGRAIADGDGDGGKGNDDAGQAVDDVGDSVGDGGEAAAGLDCGDDEGDGEDGGEDGARDGVAQGCGEGREGAGDAVAGGCSFPDPERQGDHGDAEAEGGEGQEADHDERRQQPEPDGRRGPGAAAGDAGVAAAGAERGLGEGDGEADQHQHAGQQGGGGVVELRGVLLEDGGGEGFDAEERQGAELGQHVRCDEEARPAEGRGDLRQDDATEGLGAGVAKGAGDVLEARIEAAQCCAYGKVGQGDAVKGEDENGALHLLEARAEGGPGEAGDIGGHGERQGCGEAPPRCAGEVRALGAPGGGGGDEERKRRHRNGDGERIEQQVQRVGADDVVQDARWSGLHGAQGDVADGRGDEGYGEKAGEDEPGRGSGCGHGCWGGAWCKRCRAAGTTDPPPAPP